MRYLIGLLERDGKSEGVLCTETGLVLRCLQTSGSAVTLIPPLIRHMPLQKTAVYAGLAGETDGAALSAFCKTAAPGEVTVQYAPFASALLKACLRPQESGSVLYMQGIAGAAARDGKALHTASGSAGSTAEIARAVHKAVRAAWEKTGPHTSLVTLLTRAAGLSIPEIGDVEPHLACRLAWRGFRIGDAVSTGIIRAALDALLHYIETVTASFTDTVPLYLWDIRPENGDIIKAAALDRFPGKFHIHFADTPPVLGAVRGAASLFRLSAGEDFLRCFTETYGIHLPR